jgi:hypothetical protein
MKANELCFRNTTLLVGGSREETCSAHQRSQFLPKDQSGFQRLIPGLIGGILPGSSYCPVPLPMNGNEPQEARTFGVRVSCSLNSNPFVFSNF